MTEQTATKLITSGIKSILGPSKIEVDEAVKIHTQLALIKTLRVMYRAGLTTEIDECVWDFVDTSPRKLSVHIQSELVGLRSVIKTKINKKGESQLIHMSYKGNIIGWEKLGTTPVSYPESFQITRDRFRVNYSNLETATKIQDIFEPYNANPEVVKEPEPEPTPEPVNEYKTKFNTVITELSEYYKNLMTKKYWSWNSCCIMMEINRKYLISSKCIGIEILGMAPRRSKDGKYAHYIHTGGRVICKTLKELQNACKKNGLKGYSGKDKTQLVKMLMSI